MQRACASFNWGVSYWFSFSPALPWPTSLWHWTKTPISPAGGRSTRQPEKQRADTSSHQRNGTLKGNLSFEEASVPGKTGRAVKLDGKETFVEIAQYKGVSGTHPRTVAAWIRTATTRGQITSWGTNDFGKMWNFGSFEDASGSPHMAGISI